MLKLLAFCLLWWACGLGLAAFWLLAVQGVAWIHRYRSATVGDRGCAWLLFGMALVVVHFALLWWVLQQFGASPCDPRSWPTLILLVIPLFVTAWVPSAAPRRASTFVWTLGLLIWCLAPDGPCLTEDLPEIEGSEAVRNALQGAAERARENAEESLVRDEPARLVSEATKHGEGTRRISIDDALGDPDKFFAECGTPIFISGDILFDWDSDVLNPGAEPHLRKLRRLIVLRPDLELVIEGHADQTGQEAYNVELSRRRAESLARWLVTKARIPATQIETAGFGSARPIVSDPALQFVNRRVEVLVCDQEAQDGG